VRDYSKVFWARYQELHDWEKVYKNIEKGEQKLQRFQDNQTAIAAKLAKYKNPWQELKLIYGTSKGKAYTEEEDRFILCMTHKLGYGAWDDLKVRCGDDADVLYSLCGF
jgi:SWI/SNF-related matrix-associated actin-dependent regulator of chromatin subfamily A member 5